jgi:DNA-binding response OmpR family regulator
VPATGRYLSPLPATDHEARAPARPHLTLRPPISPGRRLSPPGRSSIEGGAEIALKRAVFFSRSSAAGRENASTVNAALGRVVVVEDEAAVREAVLAGLRQEGFAVNGFADAVDPEAILACAPDLAVLDVRLPSDSGFALARRLHARSEVSIIFLTARDAVADRVEGLELGADDYVVKPFALEELLARIRAVLRRSGRLSAVLEVGDLLIDEHGGWVTRSGQEIPLTSTELRVLAFLVRHRGQALSKDQLLTQVWGYDAYDPNLVEVHVSALRRKLEAAGPRVIHTVRGIGYRFAS